jgi:flagellar motility protein MotE (MotC chaperone)
MCSPIGSTLSNQFSNYVFEKTKKLDASTISKEKDIKSFEADIKTAIADGTITKEEFNALKNKYLGENVAIVSPEMKAFLDSLNSGVGGKALGALEKLASAKMDAVEFVFEVNDKSRIIDFDGDSNITTGTDSQVINHDAPKVTVPESLIAKQPVKDSDFNTSINETNKTNFKSVNGKSFSLKNTDDLNKSALEILKSYGVTEADIKKFNYVKMNGGSPEIAALQKIMGFQGHEIDGSIGAKTLEKIAQFYKQTTEVPGNKPELSGKYADLLATISEKFGLFNTIEDDIGKLLGQEMAAKKENVKTETMVKDKLLPLAKDIMSLSAKGDWAAVKTKMADPALPEKIKEKIAGQLTKVANEQAESFSKEGAIVPGNIEKAKALAANPPDKMDPASLTRLNEAIAVFNKKMQAEIPAINILSAHLVNHPEELAGMKNMDLIDDKNGSPRGMAVEKMVKALYIGTETKIVGDESSKKIEWKYAPKKDEIAGLLKDRKITDQLTGAELQGAINAYKDAGADTKQIAEALLAMDPAKAAEAIALMKPGKAEDFILSMLPNNAGLVGKIMAKMPDDKATAIINSIGSGDFLNIGDKTKEMAKIIGNITDNDPAKAARILVKVKSEDVDDILKEMKPTVAGKLLRSMETRDLDKVMKKFDYDEKDVILTNIRKAHIPNPAGVKVPPQVFIDFPNLKALEGILKVEDYDSPSVKKLVSELAKYPEPVLKKLKAEGLNEIHIADLAVPDLDSNSGLRGVHPRNYKDPNKTWDTVPGAYSPGNNSVSIGVGGHGSDSVAIHETGHAIGAKFKDDKGVNLDHCDEMVAIHKKIFDKLSPYQQGQDGKTPAIPGNTAGCEETFAEALATLLEEGEAKTVEKYSKEMLDFLKKYVMK